MSIAFLKEHTERIPAGTPLRDKFEVALKEIETMQQKLEKFQVVDEKPKTTK